jgi:hypothetical protein
MAVHEEIWLESARVLAFCVLALLVAASIGVLLAARPAHAAEFIVNSTDDDPAGGQTDNGVCRTDTAGECTLRAAIEEANDTPGADTIEFDIGTTTAAQTIRPTSALPPITEAVTIDGYTQSDASPNTLDEGNDAVLKVQLDGRDVASGVDGLRIEAAGSTIKGLVIRRFDRGYGVHITGAGATGNRIEGNFIGLNRDGTTAPASTQAGVHLAGDSNTVGGPEPEMRNVISGNGGDGVVFTGDETSDNKVQGNYIGTTADGTGDLGNDEDGVFIQFGTNLTAVGGTTRGAGNRIAHNGGDGISISHSIFHTTEGNHILSNLIYKNAGLGIDLWGNTTNPNGVTGNDPDDADAGPNNLQNFPVIRSAIKRTASTGTMTISISGRLNSTPSTPTAPQDFVIQCFLTGGAPASDYGEGYRLLATTPVITTDNRGNVRFTCDGTLPKLGQSPGQTVSATATSIITGDTSEFSENEAITTGP